MTYGTSNAAIEHFAIGNAVSATEGMLKAYWRDVARQSFKQTWERFGFSSPLRLILTAVGGLGAVSALLFWRTEGISDIWFLARIAGAVCIVLAFPVVWGFRFIYVPAENDKEQKQSISGLTKVAAQRDTDRARLIMLNALRERGQKLLTQNITGEEFDDWKLSVNDWELTTYAVLMSYFAYAESEPFSILKYQLNQKFSHEMNGGHSALLNETAIRINHLTRVLDRYRDFWAPMSEEEQSAVMENLKKIEWVAKGIRANLERKKQI